MTDLFEKNVKRGRETGDRGQKADGIRMAPQQNKNTVEELKQGLPRHSSD